MSMALSTSKTPFEYNKAKTISECLRYFLFQQYRHFMLLLVLPPGKVLKVDIYIHISVLV